MTTANDVGGIALLTYGVDNSAISFDGEFAGGGWLSRDAGSSFNIYKQADLLRFQYDTAAVGAAVTWNDGMVMDANGKVGIGTTGPDTALHVEGELTINSASYPRIHHQIGDTVTWTVGPRDTDDYHIYRESGTGDVIINAGNVGIGTASPNSELHVEGTGRLDGTGTYTAVPGAGSDSATDAGLVLSFGDYIYNEGTGYLRKLIGTDSSNNIFI